MKNKSNQNGFVTEEQRVIIMEAQLHKMQKELEIKKKARELHRYEIWEASDGRWATYFPDSSAKKGRRLVKRKSEYDLCKAVCNLYETGKAVPAVPTVADCCRAFNKKKLDNGKITEATYQRLERALKQHMSFQDFGNGLITAISEDDVILYLKAAGAGKRLTGARFSELKTMLTGGFRWAREKGLTNIRIEDALINLGKEDLVLKKPLKLPEEEVYSVEDEAKMKEYLASHHDLVNDAILALWMTGCRKCDICALHKEDVDLEKGEIYIRRTLSEIAPGEDDSVKRPRKETDVPKTRAGIRKIPIPSDWVLFWQKCLTYNPAGVYVFGHGDTWLPPETIDSRLRSINEKLELAHLSAHKIRKTVYTEMADAGVDETFLNSMFGHVDATTGENFYHFDRRTAESRQRLVDAIPALKYPV